MQTTPTMREYLGEVYRLEHSRQGVTTGALAERLDVSSPAVVRMLRKLDQAGLVRHKPYEGVALTHAGELEALRSIRRHRLLEAFLVDVMRFGWHEVHDHAHGLESAINDEFEDRMDELCGHPATCPHGDPIPTKDGHMPTTRDEPLTELQTGAGGTLRRVKTDDPDKLRYCAELGLVPGASLAVVNRAPFNGPIRVRANGQEHVLGAELAMALRVERD